MSEILQLLWLKKKKKEMPAAKEPRKEEKPEEGDGDEETASSEYTEVTEEEAAPAARVQARNATGMSGVLLPTPKHAATPVPLDSSESEDYVRPVGGRSKRTEKPRTLRKSGTKKASSSSSPPKPSSVKGSKSGKGKQKGRAFTRCSHCWSKVSTVSPYSLSQHQKWNVGCVSWQYHNRGFQWSVAQGKAERKIQRRHDRNWQLQDGEAREETRVAEEEKKKKKRKARRRSPTPDARPPKGDRDRRRDPDPDTDSEDREGRHPKVHRQDARTYILKMPKAR